MTSFKQIKTQQSSEGPCPRWGHAMLTINDGILLFGGYQNSKYYKDLWKFSLETLQWSQIQQQGDVPPPCSNFTMNLNHDKTKVIIFGGGTLNKQKMNSTYQLDLETSTWQKINYPENQPFPWQRSYHCAQVIGNYLVVYGGEFFHDFDDLWLLDLTSHQWTEVKLSENSPKPKARKFASSFAHSNRIYIVGGCENKYDCIADAYYIDFESFLKSQDVKDLEWKELQIQNSEFIRRWGHASAVMDNKAYIFGGRCGNKDVKNIVELNLITGECQEIAYQGQMKGRRKPGFCIRNNTAFIFSGFDGSYLKEFQFINLTSKPQLNLSSQEDTYFKGLKKEFVHYQPEQFDYKFQGDIIDLELFEYETCFSYLEDNIKVPIKIRNFPSAVCQSNFTNRSKYFEYLFRSESGQICIYRPEGISNESYSQLVQIFVLYMQFGKIILNQQSIVQRLRLIPFLVEVAEYYCLQKLKQIAYKYALDMFEQRIRSRKSSIKYVLDSAFNIYQMDSMFGEYAGLVALNTLINIHNVDKVSDLIFLSKKWQDKEPGKWICSIIDKYSFELKQETLNKESYSENSLPEKFIPQNKVEQTSPKPQVTKFKRWF